MKNAFYRLSRQGLNWKVQDSELFIVKLYLKNKLMKNYGTITRNTPPDAGLLDGGVYLWRPILESDNENLGIIAILSPFLIRGEKCW